MARWGDEAVGRRLSHGWSAGRARGGGLSGGGDLRKTTVGRQRKNGGHPVEGKRVTHSLRSHDRGSLYKGSVWHSCQMLQNQKK
jgi:hypothetical protein